MFVMDKVISSWKLRQIMADKKITNQELSKKLKVITGRETHPVTISRWKQVDIMPKIDGIDLDALIQALGVDRGTLLGDKD